MNSSWRNNSNSSPGFVYFNQDFNKCPNPDDTPEFLSFGNSPRHGSPKSHNNFSPSYYSSPNQKYHRSPNAFNLRQTYRHSGGQHGSRSFDSFSSSSGSFGHHNSSGGRGKHRKRGNKHFIYGKNVSSGNCKRDMSMFIDYTCTKNPWEELEREENQRKESEIADESTRNAVDSESSSEESDTSVEKSSSSSIVEEETS